MVYSKYKRRKSRIKKKWRQQKLAVGTVAKIAYKVAKKLDNKNITYYYNNVFHAADGFNWDSVVEIVPNFRYRPINNGAVESQVMSDISNLLQDTGIVDADSQKNITVGVKAIQARISIRNPNINAIRYEAMILYIPNLNDQTDDAVDFLRPDVFMLYKKGGGNLLYDGLAKKGISNKATSSASVREYTIIARKTGTIRGTIFSGATNLIPGGGGGTDVALTMNVARKNFTLTKYFKRERRHNCKRVQAGGAQQFTDGNYYLVIFSDLALYVSPAGAIIQQHIEYCGASSLKLRIIGTTNPITT